MSSSSTKWNFTPAKLNGNAWYHVSEGRVDSKGSKDLTSMFQVTSDNGGVGLWANLSGGDAQYWQFQPLAKAGRYAIRNSKTGIFKQLTVCFNPQEVDDHHTQPCMAKSNGKDEQKWDVADWGDGTFRFINVANGTDYWLDVHKGNPMFMSSNTDTKVFQSAQHFIMTSHSAVNEGAFSTIFSDGSTTSTSTIKSASASTTHSTPTPSSDKDKESTSKSGGGGLSSGAAAGIGVGVALVVIIALIGAILLWRRRRALSRGTSSTVGTAGAVEADGTAKYGSPQEKGPHYDAGHYYQAAPQELSPDAAPVEALGDTHFRVDANSPQPGR